MLIVDGKGRKITTDEHMYIVAERDFSLHYRTMYLLV